MARAFARCRAMERSRWCAGTLVRRRPLPRRACTPGLAPRSERLHCEGDAYPTAVLAVGILLGVLLLGCGFGGGASRHSRPTNNVANAMRGDDDDVERAVAVARPARDERPSLSSSSPQPWNAQRTPLGPRGSPRLSWTCDGGSKVAWLQPQPEPRGMTDSQDDARRPGTEGSRALNLSRAGCTPAAP